MIRHILKDGTELSDISGHMVRGEDADPVYQLLRRSKNESSQSDRVSGDHNRPGSDGRNSGSVGL